MRWKVGTKVLWPTRKRHLGTLAGSSTHPPFKLFSGLLESLAPVPEVSKVTEVGSSGQVPGKSGHSRSCQTGAWAHRRLPSALLQSPNPITAKQPSSDTTAININKQWEVCRCRVPISRPNVQQLIKLYAISRVLQTSESDPLLHQQRHRSPLLRIARRQPFQTPTPIPDASTVYEA